MTPETDPCGCPKRDGHTCRPVWMDEAEWVARPGKTELQGCKMMDVKCPEPADTDPGRPHYLIEQEATPMSVPTSAPSRQTNGEN